MKETRTKRTMRYENENHDNRAKLLRILKGSRVVTKGEDYKKYIQVIGFNDNVIFESTPAQTEHAALIKAINEANAALGRQKTHIEKGEAAKTTDKIAIWDNGDKYSSAVFKTSDFAKVGENVRLVMFKNKFKHKDDNRPSFYLSVINGKGLSRGLSTFCSNEKKNDELYIKVEDAINIAWVALRNMEYGGSIDDVAMDVECDMKRAGVNGCLMIECEDEETSEE